MNKINLLEETEKVLKEHGKTLDSIWRVYVYAYEYSCPVKILGLKEFKELANIEYNNDFGGQEIKNMVAKGLDFFMFRHEYDGSEWWEYVSTTVRPEDRMEIKDLYWRYAWKY